MKLYHRDFIVIVCILMKMSTIFLTALAAQMTADMSGADIEQVLKVYEGNPIVYWLHKARIMSIIVQAWFIPAGMLAAYYAVKRLLLETSHPLSLDFIVYFMFFTVFFNFLNDLGVVIGLFMLL